MTINSVEIEPTNFIHASEKYDRTVEPGAPYTIFEPTVMHLEEDRRITLLNAQQILEQMQEFANYLVSDEYGLKPGDFVNLGGARYSIGDIIEDQAAGTLKGIRDSVAIPEALPGILSSIAGIAERSGHDRDKARMLAVIWRDDENEGELPRVLHIDGVGDTSTYFGDGAWFRTTKYIYAITGPGTIIHPKASVISGAVKAERVKADYFGNPDSVSSPKTGAIVGTSLEIDTQQVLPGRILAFDPTREFWHQAHSRPRVTLAVTIQELVEFDPVANT